MSTYHRMVVTTPLVANLATSSPPSRSARFIFPTAPVQTEVLIPRISQTVRSFPNEPLGVYYPRIVSQSLSPKKVELVHHVNPSQRASIITFGNTSRTQQEWTRVELSNTTQPERRQQTIGTGTNVQTTTVKSVIHTDANSCWTGYYRPVW